MARGKIDIDIHMCKGCEVCIASCKFDVIQLSDADKVNRYGFRYLVAHKPANCTGCGFCAQMCPDSAITVWRAGKD